MTAFASPEDIANRALQRVGADNLIAAGALQTELSKNALQIRTCYDKLRRAELRRNVWRFAIKKAALRAIGVDTIAISFNDWSSTTTYPNAAIVKYNGLPYQSTVDSNFGLEPDTNAASWAVYFGPAVVFAYDSTVSWYAGEIVYTSSNIYSSIVSGNTNDPEALAAWDETVDYGWNPDLVTYGGLTYRAINWPNVNKQPDIETDYWTAITPAAWDVGTTYAAFDVVTYSGVYYISRADANLAHTPDPVNTEFWNICGGNGWTVQGGSTQPLGIIYPVGAGPVTDVESRNVFMLPANYLRTAPQDPKRGSNSVFGAPTNRAYDDWDFESNFLISSDATPIVLRFVADIQLVSSMDDMFCEALSARIALEVCEPLTQSTAKMQEIGAEYKKFQSEAIAVNGIEVGATEPPLDDYISTRV